MTVVGARDEVCGCKKKSSKLVGSNMVGKKPIKIAQDCLMLRSRRWRHGKLSIKDLVTITVVGQQTIIVISEDDFPLRDALRECGHDRTS